MHFLPLFLSIRSLFSFKLKYFKFLYIIVNKTYQRDVNDHGFLRKMQKMFYIPLYSYKSQFVSIKKNDNACLKCTSFAWSSAREITCTSTFCRHRSVRGIYCEGTRWQYQNSKVSGGQGRISRSSAQQPSKRSS